MDASGTWRLILRDVGKEDLEEAVYLEGTTTNRTVTQHSRTYYNDYDRYASSSDDEEDEDEDDEEEEPPPKQPTKAVELPKGKDETVTEKFTLGFAKAALLSPDPGMHQRGDWKVTDLPPETPE